MKKLWILGLLLIANLAHAERYMGARGPYDLSGSVNTSAIPLEKIEAAGLQLVITGTAVGTVHLQYSNDDATPTNWTTVSGSTQAVSGAGTVFWSIANVAQQWVRVVYTSTSDTGSALLQATLR